jgi:hypothetical protein
MHLRHVLNLLHFRPDLGALYALRHTLKFYETTPEQLKKAKTVPLYITKAVK